MADRVSSKDLQEKSSLLLKSLDPCPDENAIMSLPRSLHEAYKLHLSQTGHPAVKMLGSSIQAHRSCNEAILFLYGMSGAGKSSTLNHLFGRYLVPTSDRDSCTDSVTEWVSSLTSEEWQVSNLEVGFVDMPGWGDSQGKDAANFALIQHFLTIHPILGSKIRKFYPNIVLLVFNSNDNRMLGSDANAMKMLQALSKLSIVDRKHPNVVIVLTHVCSHPASDFVAKLQELSGIYQTLSRSCLGVNPPVVWLENHSGYPLQRSGDWTLLHDGTAQPVNLYEAMRTLMVDSRDELGKEALRLYFQNRASNPPKEKLRVNSNNLTSRLHSNLVKQWLEEMQKGIKHITMNEVNSLLFRFVQENKSFRLDKDDISGLLIALQDAGIQECSDLNSLSMLEIENLLKPFLLSPIEMILLMECFEIKSPDLSKSLFAIGRGYNTEKGEISPRSIFDWTHNSVFDPFFCQHLSQAVSVIPLNGKQLTFGAIEDYSAIQQLQVAIDHISNCLFHNTLQESRLLTVEMLERKLKELSQYLFRIEISIVSVKLNFEFVRFSSEFCAAVRSLAVDSISDETQISPDFSRFFREFGHFVLLQANGGGLIEGRHTLTKEEIADIHKIRAINMAVELYFDLIQEGYKWRDLTEDLKTEDISLLQKVDASPLTWLAGDPRCTCQYMSELSEEMYSKWMSSLKNSFILFESTSCFAPIYLLAQRIDPAVGDAVKRAFELLFPNGQKMFNEHLLPMDCIGTGFEQKEKCKLGSPSISRPVPESLRRFKLRSHNKHETSYSSDLPAETAAAGTCNEVHSEFDTREKITLRDMPSFN